MVSRHSASRIQAPAGAASTDVATIGVLPSGAKTTLGSTMNSMKESWPAVDATNGPITALTGIVVGSPTTTGWTNYAWNSGVFNTQSQNLVAVPTGASQNTYGVSLCMNASTPRIWTFGNMTNFPVESQVDLSFITDATSVTFIWANYTAYTGNNNQDVSLWAEHSGKMKRITNNTSPGMPMFSTAGNGLSYLTVTMKEAREIEYRILLPANCWFGGVWINNGAMIRKAPNKFLMAGNGDSWQEPYGNIVASPIFGAYSSAGTYRTYNLREAIIEATGWAYISMAQGGTGEFNCNDATARPQTYTLNGVSVFHGQTRIDDCWTKFGSKSPFIMTIGGWNDGTLGGTPYQTTYQAAVTSGIARWVGKRSDIALGYASIQPVDFVNGDARDLSLAGQAAACAASPNVVGFINIKPMWADRSNTAGSQRMVNCNSTDTIHLTAKGANAVSNYLLADMKSWFIPTSYYTAMLNAP